MAKDVKKTQQKISHEACQEEIRALAQENFRKRTSSNKPGDELSDWLQAEKEVKKKYGI
jgi:hypothetical protein